MEYLFGACYSLSSLDLSNFKTSNVRIMKQMFYKCTNLISLNLSNFNTSLVTNMDSLFMNCYSLTSITFSELFDTSQVTVMNAMFSNCYKLSTLNLSYFDTAKVEKMNNMFNYCINLKYLDLSNFYATNLKSLNYMFNSSNSLIYLNLNSFKINNDLSGLDIQSIFNFNKSKTKICIKDSYTQQMLLENNNLTSDCSNICFNNNSKVDLNLDKCICSENTYLAEDNLNICYDINPEGYYFDIDESIYKKCFHSCKYCNASGNEENNNCIECISNPIFLNESLYKGNCYEKCDNYYYFNESNNYKCTQDKICPENYNKLIINKNKCIDKCHKDDIYKYEYNDTCFENCPIGTIIDEENFICLKKDIK